MAIHCYTSGARCTSLALDDALQSSDRFGCGTLGLDLRFIAVNSALAAMHGVPAEDHRGRHVHDVVPALSLQFEAAVDELLESGESVLTGEFAGALKMFYPVCEDGEVVAVGFLVVDLTERRRTEPLRPAHG
jgi:PAS domain-containing protein